MAFTKKHKVIVGGLLFLLFMGYKLTTTNDKYATFTVAEVNNLIKRENTKETVTVTENKKVDHTSLSDSSRYLCKPFKKYNATFCIHDPQRDFYISSLLNQGIMYEPIQVNRILRWLRRDTSLGLIDLGANIGVYSIPAAAQGAYVLAFEPFPPNSRLLKKSIEISGLQNKITVIEKGVADKQYNFSMEVADGNQGRVSLVKKDCGHYYNKTDTRFPIRCSEYKAETLTLDDIPHLPAVMNTFRRALLKIDIEGLERSTIMASSSFWQELDIPVIQIEWQWFQIIMKNTVEENKATEELIAFLMELGYMPYHGRNVMELRHMHWRKWSNDVYWVKQGFNVSE